MAVGSFLFLKEQLKGIIIIHLALLLHLCVCVGGGGGSYVVRASEQAIERACARAPCCVTLVHEPASASHLPWLSIS